MKATGIHIRPPAPITDLSTGDPALDERLRSALTYNQNLYADTEALQSLGGALAG